MTLQLDRPTRPARTELPAPVATPLLEVMSQDEREFLADRRLAVLATGRRDGSPQISMVYYHFDGHDLVVSVTTDRAKWANVCRQPSVALLVNEGRRQLVVYGRAIPIDTDPMRTALHRRLRRAMGHDVEQDDRALAAELEDANRVIIRIVPTHALMNN
jgi:PPOX class probable F420-dependent enzyme